MITVKISDLLNSTEVLQKLAGTELKAKTAWQVGRILKAADTEIQSFNEARVSLIQQFGEKDENGQLITDDRGNCKIPNEVITDFSDQLNELVNTDIEINAHKLKIDDIGDKNFTPAEMTQLEAFIEFDE